MDDARLCRPILTFASAVRARSIITAVSFLIFLEVKHTMKVKTTKIDDN